MIICGCCIIPLCTSYISFTVKHQHGEVTLSNFEHRLQKLAGLTVTMPWREYAEQVYDFTIAALSFISVHPPNEESDDIQHYRELRAEHVNLCFKLKELLSAKGSKQLTESTATPLFNFQLLPIKEVSLFGYEHQLRLHWYGLTDGCFWLHVGDEKLLRYNDAFIKKSKAAGETWDNPYLEYHVVRLWEDFQDILPSILEPIPEAICLRCDPGLQGWEFHRLMDIWHEENDELNIWYTAVKWLSDRELNLGYLSCPQLIRFWNDGSTMHITWDIKDDKVEGIPFWSTQQGEFTMPLANFIKEVRSFDERLIAAMAVRVQAARADWPLPEVEIDLDGLEIEHRDRATWMDQAFARARFQQTDWDAVAAAMDMIERKSTETKEWS